MLGLARTRERSAGFDELFATGIDPLDGGLPAEPASFWPSAERVRAYGDRVRAALDDALAHADVNSIDERLQVAIEHRWMHAETLAYLLHELPTDWKRAPAPGREAAPLPRASHIERRMVRIPSGMATLGRPRGGGFGWDNEFEETRVAVPEFADPIDDGDQCRVPRVRSRRRL